MLRNFAPAARKVSLPEFLPVLAALRTKIPLLYCTLDRGATISLFRNFDEWCATNGGFTFRVPSIGLLYFCEVLKTRRISNFS